MPGAYAHMTLVNLLKETARLEGSAGFPNAAIPAVLDHFKFCELGAVSPDYPYLAVDDSDAAKWADLMHYENTGEIIKRGVEAVRGETGATRDKCLAWLLGYTAHVSMDVTIHPVVEMKVGEYAENKTAHRVCEMNQDAHIFERLGLGDIGLSEHLDSGISACSSADDPDAVDPDIARIWSKCLEAVHPSEYENNRPDINRWHSRFRFMVDTIGEEGVNLIPLARHVAVNQGLTYPRFDEIDQQYIQNLQTPQGRMDYDAIFNQALENVLHVWGWVASGVFDNDQTYLAEIGNWNLDTGRNEAGAYVFWA